MSLIVVETQLDFDGSIHCFKHHFRCYDQSKHYYMIVYYLQEH